MCDNLQCCHLVHVTYGKLNPMNWTILLSIELHHCCQVSATLRRSVHPWCDEKSHNIIYSHNIIQDKSPCHLVPSSRIRPLATAVVAPLHPALSLAYRLMSLMVAPLAYPLRVSTHICLGLLLFLVPFILPSITSSSIPPALTTCPT